MDERERGQDGGRRTADGGLGVGGDGDGGGGVGEKVEKEISPSRNRVGSGNAPFLGAPECLSGGCAPLPVSLCPPVGNEPSLRRGGGSNPPPSHLLLFVILHRAAARLGRSHEDNERSGRLRLAFNLGSANISVPQPALPQGNDDGNRHRNMCERTH